MTDPNTGMITRLLRKWSSGDKDAFGELMPLVQDELRRQARGYFRAEPAGHTLQPTALVNEAYMRLVKQDRVQWQDRAHFFGIAAQTMRRVLVDHARKRHAVKHGGEAERVTLNEEIDGVPEKQIDLLALDAALDKLTKLDPRQGKIVELRYFGGLSVKEAAGLMQIGTATVKREWASAKAWLYRELSRK